MHNYSKSYIFINKRSGSGARWALRVMVAGILALLFWASVANISQVTRAPVQLVSAGRIQSIQSPDGGVLTQIHVKEGDLVAKGQVLATLEKARAQAAVSDVSAKVAALKITLTRLQAEVYEKPLQFSRDLLKYESYIRNQTDLYNKRQKAFKDDIAALTTILNLARAELELNKPLLDKGDISRSEILRFEKAVADASAQLASRRNKYFQESQAEMTKAQEELSTQTEQLRDRSQLLQHTELYASVDGYVNSIKATTLGAVVRPGEVVLEISPSGGELFVEAKLSTSDIGFVNVNQDAIVKLDAYDSSIYGGINARVSYISPDILIEDTKQGPHSYYRVLLELLSNEFQGAMSTHISLKPGLSGSVEIKASDRTVLNYLTKPLTKTLSQSLGEK